MEKPILFSTPMVQDHPELTKPDIWDKLDRLLWHDTRALDAVAVGVCILSMVYIVAQVIRAIL